MNTNQYKFCQKISVYMFLIIAEFKENLISIYFDSPYIYIAIIQ